MRKELTDARRGLADSNIERDKYANTNKDLRDHVKRVEGQRREQGRNLEEALQKISNLEEHRNAMDVEKTRLSTVLKETQNNLTKLTQEHQAAQSNIAKIQQNSGQKDVLEKELQGRLSNETEERERVQLELHGVKKQVSYCISFLRIYIFNDYAENSARSFRIWMRICMQLVKSWAVLAAKPIKTSTGGTTASRSCSAVWKKAEVARSG